MVSLKTANIFLFQEFVILMQTQIEPEFVLFFDCPEEEMERGLLSRNQIHAGKPVKEVFECVKAVLSATKEK
ncbi:hypothetical protein RJ641_000939, partial [Dillenia turbinata]